jgi:hypothetical protein
MGVKAWVPYRPKWAPHVAGSYTEREFDPEERRYLPQQWQASCEVCRAQHGPVWCESGLVRDHVSTFALAHLHRDPLSPVPVKA